MKVSDLRIKHKEEFPHMISENREKLRALRFDLASGKVKNVREVRKVKKNIARMFTLIKEAKNGKQDLNK